MDDAVRQALDNDRLIDITTTGRKTGDAHRIEIGFRYMDGRLFITGRPGRPRSWYANLRADSGFIFHLKESVQRDLPATATPITDGTRRREVFSRMWETVERLREMDMEEWVSGSPLVEVELNDQAD